MSDFIYLNYVAEGYPIICYRSIIFDEKLQNVFKYKNKKNI
jgi:hypothetical protein